jgi:hypothetical protein
VGIEWTIGCLGCQQRAHLGSMKPFKWSGFQMGNRFVAEWLALHAMVGCSLIVTRDDLAFDPPWWRDDTAASWLVDLRSRSFFDSFHPAAKPPEMVCAACKAPLEVPPGPEWDELRRYAAPPRPGAAMPLIVGEYLWFCGPACRDTFRAVPPRTWRPCPQMGEGVRLQVRCGRCNVDTSLRARDPAPSDAYELAEWLIDHVFDRPDGSDLDPEAGCILEVRLDSARLAVHTT